MHVFIILWFTTRIRGIITGIVYKKVERLSFSEMFTVFPAKEDWILMRIESLSRSTDLHLYQVRTNRILTTDDHRLTTTVLKKQHPILKHHTISSLGYCNINLELDFRRLGLPFSGNVVHCMYDCILELWTSREKSTRAI